MQKIHVLLREKEESEGPLGTCPLEGLLTFTPLLPPNSEDGGHLTINLCDGDTFIGALMLVWESPIEHTDPRVGGSYLYATGYIDQIDLEIDIEDDARMRDIVLDCMGRCGIALEKSIRMHRDAREFIVVSMKRA